MVSFRFIFIAGALASGLPAAAQAQAQQPAAGAAPGTARPAAAPAATVTLSGYLRDAATGEALIGATVYVAALGLGATANEYGFYSLTLPRGTHTLTYSFVGYAARQETLTLDASRSSTLKLAPAGVQTDEVVVTGRAPDQNVRSTETGTARLDARQVKLVPALLGEADVVRAIQLLPGVSTVGEGATGFNVRGGGVDQNLILLDEAPVYNSSHLFGLFSVFNPDAVKDLKLVKGGIPATYGGRLSSLLDIRLKDGNSQRFAAGGGVGVVSSRLSVEAPIVKDKGSFIVAGRRSYADLFLKASSNPDLKNTAAYFYDLTAKANYTLGERDRLFLSGYFGRDVFRFGKLVPEQLGQRHGHAALEPRVQQPPVCQRDGPGQPVRLLAGHAQRHAGLRVELQHPRLQPEGRLRVLPHPAEHAALRRQQHLLHVSARPRRADGNVVHLPRADLAGPARHRAGRVRRPGAAAGPGAGRAAGPARVHVHEHWPRHLLRLRRRARPAAGPRERAQLRATGRWWPPTPTWSRGPACATRSAKTAR